MYTTLAKKKVYANRFISEITMELRALAPVAQIILMIILVVPTTAKIRSPILVVQVRPTTKRMQSLIWMSQIGQVGPTTI